MVPLTYFLYLASALFVIGLCGVLVRRNVLIVLMSIELMLNAANIALITFSRQWGALDGQVIAFFTIAVAAAEAAVGLAIVVAVFRARTGIDIDDVRALRD
jgi:NADH-quinone oxidoreductase subunit K